MMVLSSVFKTLHRIHWIRNFGWWKMCLTHRMYNRNKNTVLMEQYMIPVTGNGERGWEKNRNALTRQLHFGFC